MKRLASLELALVALAGLALWLGLGAALGFVNAWRDALREMNGMLLGDWLSGPALGEPWLLAWFLVLCAWAGLLGLNLVLCLILRLTPRLSSGGIRAWLAFLAHILFGLVMIGHAASLVVGHKVEDVDLYPGQSAQMGAYSLELAQTHYGADPKLLNMGYRRARRALTTKSFRLNESWAQVRLVKDGGEVLAGRVIVMDPLVDGSLRVTLNRFLPPKDGKVGARLALASAPLARPFLAAYGILVILLAAMAILGPRRRDRLAPAEQ